ncbi:MAG: hypothetical protein HQM08_17510 [Candidatus Riflebacteria bacterium]|nr:hypothetical protein [Candidatus Riflebacteria bacterium]
MRKSAFSVVFLAACFCFLFSGQVSAQVSFGSGDSCDLTVNVDGVKDSYTVIRDFKNPKQWYYVPNRVRLAQKTAKDTQGKTTKLPVFHLIKYQSTQGSDVVEGGMLQFSVSLSPDPRAIPQLKKGLQDKTGVDEKKLNLSPLPIDSAEVTVYKPDGTMVKDKEAVQQPGIAPSFANQEIPFQVSLNSLGADVYEDLVKGGGGLPILVTFNYTGVTPPCTAKVEVNWDVAYSHLSTDQETKQAYYNWNWWWYNTRNQSQTSTQQVRENLTKNGAITITQVGDGKTDLDSLINPVIDKFQKELVEAMEPPAKVEPAQAKKVDSPGWWQSESNYAMKDINKVKKGKETFEFTKQSLVSRKTSFGGVIGIGEYSKDIQDKLVTTMAAKNWQKSYYLLPMVGDGLGVTKIVLQVKPVMPDKKTQITNVGALAATWMPDTQWIDEITKVKVNYLVFGMQGSVKTIGEEQIKNCFYQLNLVITQKAAGKVDTFNFTSYEPFCNGDVPVNTPLSVLEGFKIDALGDLVYGNQAGNVYKVGITVSPTSPAKKYTATITSQTDPKEVVFLVAKEDNNVKNPVIVDIQFEMFGGKKFKWAKSGKNIRDIEDGLSLTLWQSDIDSGLPVK